MRDGAEGELVLTHLVNRSAPLLRFRTRDHVRLGVGPCACGRTAPRVRCIGRTDDMLIVRGVNVFPVRGARGRQRIRARGDRRGHDPPAARRACGRSRRCRSRSRRSTGAGTSGLAERIRARLREALLVTTEIDLVAAGQLAAQRVQVQTRRAKVTEGRAMQKLQTQGLHHITLVGADRQTSIDFWEGVLGMPFIFEQPNLDNAAREPSSISIPATGG